MTNKQRTTKDQLIELRNRIPELEGILSQTQDQLNRLEREFASAQDVAQSVMSYTHEKDMPKNVSDQDESVKSLGFKSISVTGGKLDGQFNYNVAYLVYPKPSTPLLEFGIIEKTGGYFRQSDVNVKSFANLLMTLGSYETLRGERSCAEHRERIFREILEQTKKSEVGDKTK
jgi:hypothetical protein